MARAEEIEKAAREYEASPVDWNNEDIEIRDFFKRGAEWADQHPRKGLVDIEKVVEWLEEKIDDYLYINVDWHAPQLEVTLYEDLKKAMGGE